MHLFLIEHIGLLPTQSIVSKRRREERHRARERGGRERESKSERHFKYHQLVFIKRVCSRIQFTTGKSSKFKQSSFMFHTINRIIEIEIVTTAALWEWIQSKKNYVCVCVWFEIDRDQNRYYCFKFKLSFHFRYCHCEVMLRYIFLTYIKTPSKANSLDEICGMDVLVLS